MLIVDCSGQEAPGHTVGGRKRKCRLDDEVAWVRCKIGTVGRNSWGGRAQSYPIPTDRGPGDYSLIPEGLGTDYGVCV